MDIIRQCAEQPNIRARTLLRSRGLSERQIDYFLILACARLIRTYITYRHDFGTAIPDEPGYDTLLCRMHLVTLAERVDLDDCFTTEVVRALAPGVIAKLHRALGGKHSLLNLFDDHDAA